MSDLGWYDALNPQIPILHTLYLSVQDSLRVLDSQLDRQAVLRPYTVDVSSLSALYESVQCVGALRSILLKAIGCTQLDTPLHASQRLCV